MSARRVVPDLLGRGVGDGGVGVGEEGDDVMVQGCSRFKYIIKISRARERRMTSLIA